jgi:three-Cys-motif partner protein
LSSKSSTEIVPPEYRGREQSFLKHQVLASYLAEWGHKLGSTGRARGRTKLWYIDAFAGPWDQRHPDLADTSIVIGLNALEQAAQTWRDRGHIVDVEAVFVEKKPKSFDKLKSYLERRSGTIVTHPLSGEFSAHVRDIQRRIAGNAAFIFVDPTGWKGAAMEYIAPLVSGPAPRDVLINVMFDHLNRQKDREVQYIREQMRDFFGLGDVDLPADLDEDGLMALYRLQLKRKTGLNFAADLAIPHPTMERTKFILVAGGRSPKVLEVFRSVEARVVGRKAAAIRDEAMKHRRESRSGQISLDLAPPSIDRHYEVQHQQDLCAAEKDILDALDHMSPLVFKELWPPILEGRHLTISELRALVGDLWQTGAITVSNARHGERTVKDEHLLVLRR